MQLFKKLIEISSITLISRILGFARDTIIARVFGAEMITDAFFAAFKIPNLLRRIFAEGALAQVFVPIFIEYKNQNGKQATKIFFSCVIGLLILILLLLIFFGILSAPWIIMITTPGFIHLPEKFNLTISLLRIVFPYIIFISLTSLISAVLNTWNIFLIPAFTPIILNISIISFALFCTSFFHQPITSLAWGVIFGGILQLLYQLPYLKKINMLVLPRIQLRNTGISRVLRNMCFNIIGASVSQISLIMNTIFASFLVSGSISWIYYADRLIELPSGILGVTLGTILLPSLSKSFVQNNDDEYSKLLDWGLRFCLLLAPPSAIMLGVLSHPLIVTIFQYGKFSSLDTLMTQHALTFYSVGLIGIVIVKILTPAFYSRQDVKTPIKIAIFILILTQLMNYFFIGPFKHAGLSLSIGLSANINAILLYWQLRRQKLFYPQPGWSIFLLRLLLASTAMAVTLLFLLLINLHWLKHNMLLRLIYLVCLMLSSIIIYFFTLWLSGIRPYHFKYGNKYINLIKK